MIIVIEGLPGSGKTTTAKSVASYFQDQGYSVDLFLENSQNNPVGFLWNLDTIPDAIKKTTLEQYPFESWLRIPSKGKDIAVLESRLLQNTSYFWMLDGKDEMSAGTVPQKIIETLNGHCQLKLIYLSHSNSELHLQKIIEERKPVCPSWIPFVTNFHDKQPWLLNRGLKGESGFYKTLLHWSDLQKQIFNGLHCTKLEIIDPSNDWQNSLNEIYNFIK